MSEEERLEIFRARLAGMPNGYVFGQFDGKRYGITVSRPTPGVVKLYAEELGGADIVSFNHYSPAARGPVLKPCEMSSEKVIDFVLGVVLDQS